MSNKELISSRHLPQRLENLDFSWIELHRFQMLKVCLTKSKTTRNAEQSRRRYFRPQTKEKRKSCSTVKVFNENKRRSLVTWPMNCEAQSLERELLPSLVSLPL